MTEGGDVDAEAMRNLKDGFAFVSLYLNMIDCEVYHND
jgi:hypothetical protein